MGARGAFSNRMVCGDLEKRHGAEQVPGGLVQRRASDHVTKQGVTSLLVREARLSGDVNVSDLIVRPVDAKDQALVLHVK
jgi:hypothetical protein